jgi:hypothetical protein
MPRKVLGALVLGVLAACSELPGSACRTDEECGAGRVCELQRCVVVGDAPEPQPDGGQCEPACSTYEVCTAQGGTPSCVSRYTELRFVRPTAGQVTDGGVVAVQVQLEARSSSEQVFPPGSELDFRAVQQPDGGVAGTWAAVTGSGGTYSTQWQPPAGEGSFLLRAAQRDGGLSAQVQVAVDRTAPALSVSVAPATRPGADGGFEYVDPVAPQAWGRHQTARVVVESTSVDLDPGSASVVVRGVNGGASVTDLQVSLGSASCGAGVAFCGNVDVPLWRPGLNGFRGSHAVEVTARDRAGNEARNTSASIPVTRWMWSFNAGTVPISTTPAIGSSGTVYFANRDLVFALDPIEVDGANTVRKRWERQLGTMESSLAVGEPGTGQERVYASANIGSGAALFALASGDGSTALRCPGTGVANGPSRTALTVLKTRFSNEADVETTVVLADNDGLLSVRPDSGSATRQCPLAGIDATGSRLGSLIAQGTNIYFYGSGSLGSKISNYYFENGWRDNSLFASSTTALPTVGMGFVSGNRILASGGVTAPVRQGGLFTLNRANGSQGWQYPNPFSLSLPVNQFVVGQLSGQEVIFFGRELQSGGAELVALAVDGTAPLDSVSTSSTSFLAAPVLGASTVSGGSPILYTAATRTATAGVGEVAAWSADGLDLLWRLSDTVGRVEGSPTLDCARRADGSPANVPYGVLYVPSTNGRLYAFTVDSPRLDTSAPWPKYQRDARNTGNLATPLSTCSPSTP